MIDCVLAAASKKFKRRGYRAWGPDLLIDTYRTLRSIPTSHRPIGCVASSVGMLAPADPVALGVGKTFFEELPETAQAMAAENVV